jgi:hypothetical protein
MAMAARPLTAGELKVLDAIDMETLRSYFDKRLIAHRMNPPHRQCGHKVDTPKCPHCERAVYLQRLKAKLNAG